MEPEYVQNAGLTANKIHEQEKVHKINVKRKKSICLNESKIDYILIKPDAALKTEIFIY